MEDPGRPWSCHCTGRRGDADARRPRNAADPLPAIRTGSGARATI